MKKIFYFLIFCIFGFCSCGANINKKIPNNDSLENKDSLLEEGVDLSQIIPILCTDNGTCLYIYESQEDSILRNKYAKKYTTIIDGNNQLKISYKCRQIGKAGMGMLISNSKYNSHMSGLLYNNCDNKNLSGFYYAVTDKFIEENNFVNVDNVNSLDVAMPTELIKKLEKKYNNQITASHKCATIDDGKASLYVAQFKPSDDSCLAVRVLVDGNKTYIYEDYAVHMSPGEGPTWHVDDDGEYYPVYVDIATRDKNGLKIFYSGSAPESTYFGVLYTKGNELCDVNFLSYYNYIDYVDESLPASKEAFLKLWNKYYSKETPSPQYYKKIDIDNDDCDEIVLKSSEEGQVYMALFTCKNDVPKLVCIGDIYTTYKYRDGYFFTFFNHGTCEIIDAYHLSNSNLIESASEIRHYAESEDESDEISYEWKYAKGQNKFTDSTKEMVAKLTKQIEDTYDIDSEYGWIDLN